MTWTEVGGKWRFAAELTYIRLPGEATVKHQTHLAVFKKKFIFKTCVLIRKYSRLYLKVKERIEILI